MHTVGDGSDRHLRRVEPRPQPGEHVAAHVAVQQRHPVGTFGQPETHVRHVEHRRICFATEVDDSLDGDPRQQHRLLPRPEITPHQIRRKPVDPRRHRSMRGEHRPGPHRSQRGVEIEPPVRHQFPNALHTQEPRMPLVGVEHLRIRHTLRMRVRPHRPHPTHPGQNLRLDPMILIPAIQAVGDPPQLRIVLRDIGVQQQQRDPPDLRDPHPRPQHPTARHPHTNQYRCTALCFGEQTQR